MRRTGAAASRGWRAVAEEFGAVKTRHAPLRIQRRVARFGRGCVRDVQNSVSILYAITIFHVWFDRNFSTFLHINNYIDMKYGNIPANSAYQHNDITIPIYNSMLMAHYYFELDLTFG